MSTELKFKDLYVTVSETVSYTVRLSDLLRPDVMLDELEDDPWELPSVLEAAWCNLPSTQPYCDGVDEQTMIVYADDHGGRTLNGDELIPILEAATDYKTQDEGGVV